MQFSNRFGEEFSQTNRSPGLKACAWAADQDLVTWPRRHELFGGMGLYVEAVGQYERASCVILDKAVQPEGWPRG